MGTINILHIEDDLSDAILIKKLLQQSSKPNYQITNFVRIADGIKALEQNSYDAVLLDLSLTDVSGIDSLRCIKDENPYIPIVVLTGQNNESLSANSPHPRGAGISI